MMNQEPIFLLGAHKSGTSLLRSIFNGHSQIYTIPIEAHYFQNMKYWVDYEYRAQRPQNLTNDEIIESFCNWIHTCNSSEDPYSDSIAKGLFNEDKFKEVFSEIKYTQSEKERIEIYFRAIYYSVSGKFLPEEIRIVEKSIENAEFAVELSTFFPRAKFIHIVRNPYANIVSLRKFKSIYHDFALIPRVIKSLYNSYYYLYKNSKIIQNYYILKYEDLVTEPELQIKKICQFLNLPFEDILLIPTYQGKPWVGNSTSGEPFRGIESSRLNKWKKEIHPMEIYYVNKIFPFVLRDYGYEIISQSGSFWKKARGENLKRYLYNRIYRFYHS
ncbi:MAG: sulfotransferase family protein [Promethearchaeota archaeon]